MSKQPKHSLLTLPIYIHIKLCNLMKDLLLDSYHCLLLKVLVGQVMSPRHSDKTSQRLQVSMDALWASNWGCLQNGRWWHVDETSKEVFDTAIEYLSKLNCERQSWYESKRICQVYGWKKYVNIKQRKQDVGICARLGLKKCLQNPEEDKVLARRRSYNEEIERKMWQDYKYLRSNQDMLIQTTHRNKHKTNAKKKQDKFQGDYFLRHSEVVARRR